MNTSMAYEERPRLDTYEEAFAKSERQGKPLLVIVGAGWCAPCQAMKRDTIEPMLKADLDNVAACYIDKDERPELAKQLMRGETLPQLIIFRKDRTGWKRFGLLGSQDRRRVLELVRRAIQ
jgi:thioredoxin-like negative regulator of GroEL